MQNEGALRMLGKCSTRCHLEMHGHLDHYDIGTYEMLARSEGTATSSTNVAGVCATKLCYFCGASVVALEEGGCIHEYIFQSGHELDIFVGNCLVDIYAKCGRIGGW
jgi:hypothetical protein